MSDTKKTAAIDLFYELLMTARRKRGDLKVPEIPDNIQGQVNSLSEFSNEIRKQKAPLVFEVQGSNPVSELTESIAKHPDMIAYRLNKNDIDIITNLVSQTLLPFHSDMNGMELLRYINMPKLERLKSTGILVSLLDRRILKLTGDVRFDYHANNPVFLLQARYDYDTLFFNALLGSSIFSQAYEDLRSKIGHGQDEIYAYMAYFEALFNNYPELTTLHSGVNGNYFGQALALFYSNLCDSFHKPRNNSSVLNIKQKYDLKDTDLIALLLVYYHVCYKREEMPCQILINLLAGSQVEAYQLYIDIKKSNLIRKDLMKFMHSFIADKKCVYLNDKIRRELGINPADDFEEIPDLEDILNSNDDMISPLANDKRLTVAEPLNVGIDSLILPEKIKEIIRIVVRKTANPERYSLAKWELFAEQKQGLSQGTAILLHGQPGVGKTMTAEVIAHSLNRKIIRIEASRLRDKYYGETQKILKDVFAKMRDIIKESSPEDPVFLLNECDQLIHGRQIIGDDGSCRDVENSIQNIILEELETFPGIIIMTTNLVEQLDAAFSRRFNYKIELPLPDEECRKELWKLHLPPSIPGADSIDLNDLAEQFNLSGGQIRLIVKNACSEAICRSEGNFLTHDDLTKYASLESGSSFEKKESKKIGFGR